MAGVPMVVPSSGALQMIGRQELLGFSLLGLSVLQNRLFKIGRFVEKRVRKRDQDAAQEMVDRMRADAPYDSGDLYGGIRWWEEDGAFIVQASAVHPDRRGGEDYAGFVEHGTRAGERDRSISYVADSNYHDLSVGLGDGSIRETGRTYGRRRLQYRGHPGTPAQPFFYQNARDVLNERGADAEQIAGLALDEDSDG
jgi:hypothetical protein